MNILVLHRVPYPRIDYARGIDHDRHDVTYFGKPDILDTIPAELRCSRVERAGDASAFDEASAWLEARPQRFDVVISLSEYELIDAAKLRARFGIAGKSVDEVMLVRDKVKMKAAVRDAGVRVPRFLPLRTWIDAQGHTPWHGKTVLKPHSGASSADVVVFDTPAALVDALAAGRTGVAALDSDAPRIQDFQLEEFVDGPILHFDGIVADGTPRAITASRYVGTCLGYAAGQPLGSFHFALSDTARRWVERVLAAVRIDTGSFHLEAIEQDGELVFLEVGNRVGGADVVATFELATGIHLPSVELRLLIGEPASLPARTAFAQQLWHGWFVFPGHHVQGGRFHGFSGIEPFRTSPAVLAWAELETGRAFASNVTYSARETPLAGIIGTPSPDETREWIERLFASASLCLSVPASS
ncbi:MULTISPECIES: acetyl-CoA carboxylase biotin carboxylase subunit family protein [Burkholderia]|uniref:ATP-grasp domain-containing protein n=1 Tax=Burkholderia TaxID=32008 RepID=UPI00145452D4|nr:MULTISPECIES: ATP-grasp domain-containing protein [Burkholderia]MBN3769424.1 ATP-grasp domain-containing protein [Burkholderia sp. Se-20378]VWM11026.1 ATP-grasp domain protein [Burkholderia lata]